MANANEIKRELKLFKGAARRARKRIEQVAAGQLDWLSARHSLDALETRAYNRGLTGEQGGANDECEQLLAELEGQFARAREAAHNLRAWAREVEATRLADGQGTHDATTQAYLDELRIDRARRNLH